MKNTVKLSKESVAIVYCLCFMAERSVDFVVANPSHWLKAAAFFTSERISLFEQAVRSMPSLYRTKRQPLSTQTKGWFLYTMLQMWASVKPCPDVFKFNETDIAFITNSINDLLDLLHHDSPNIELLTTIRRNLGICQSIIEKKWFNREAWDMLRQVDHYCRNPIMGVPIELHTAVSDFIKRY